MSMRRALLMAVALCCAFLESAESQGAGEALRHAIALSDSGKWEQAAGAFCRLLDGGTLSRDEQTLARKILGLAYLSLGQDERAVAVYQEMVRHDASLDMTVLGDTATVEAIRCLGQAVMAVRREEIEQRMDRLRRVSRRGAVLRSTILPGWGQRYQGDPHRGYLMAGLTVSAVTYAVMTQRAYWQARNTYRHASTGSDFDALFDTSERKGDTANRAWRLMGGIWLLNIVDAVLQGPNLAGPDMAVTIPAAHDGVQLAYRRWF